MGGMGVGGGVGGGVAGGVGLRETIKYLSQLGREHLSLILEFSGWVIEGDASRSVSIFTTERKKEEDLPHKEIYEHLKNSSPPLKECKEVREYLPMQYLEFVIQGKGEQEPFFHNELVFVYLDIIKALNPASPSSSNQPESVEESIKSKGENSVLSFYRKKLISFLESSKHYKAETMLSRFPPTDLFEERAILLSRIGRHFQALSIYAHKLKNSLMAEEYCSKHYEASSEEGREVYLSLLRVYLQPPDDLPIKVEPALDLLNKYHRRMDVAKALELVPPNLPLHRLENFFDSVLQESTFVRKENKVLLSILKSQELVVREQLFKCRSRVIKIWENTVCPICQRPLQNAVFTAFPISKENPNGKVVHLACSKGVSLSKDSFN